MAIAGLALVALVSAGCVTIGPKVVRGSRVSYNDALAGSWKEQLLLNLVRMRYGDTPFFVDISQVQSLFSLSARAGLGGTFQGGADAGTADAGVGWEEQPVVTYVPLSGDKFVRELMSPISLETLLLLPQNGWSVERVLRCCVQSLNGVLNAPAAAGPTPSYEPVYHDFQVMARILRELQIARLLESEIRLTGEEEAQPPAAASKAQNEAQNSGAELVLRILDPERIRELNPSDSRMLERRAERLSCLAETLESYLGPPKRLDNGDREYHLVPPGVASSEKSIEIQTRSLLGILYYLSHGVEIAERHRDQVVMTRARPDQEQLEDLVCRSAPPAESDSVEACEPTSGPYFEWCRVTGGLLQVREGASLPAPDEVFAAARYQGRWFYIPSTDASSKSTFSLITQLFMLQSTEKPGLTPLLLNVGG